MLENLKDPAAFPPFCISILQPRWSFFRSWSNSIASLHCPATSQALMAELYLHDTGPWLVSKWHGWQREFWRFDKISYKFNVWIQFSLSKMGIVQFQIVIPYWKVVVTTNIHLLWTKICPSQIYHSQMIEGTSLLAVVWMDAIFSGKLHRSRDDVRLQLLPFDVDQQRDG